MMKPIFSQPKWLAGLIILVVAILPIGGCVPANQAPAISSLTANEELVESTDILQVECIAADPDGDELIYSWLADGGNISGEGSTVTWTAPETPGAYIITVKATDGRDGEATAQLTISVVAPNHPPLIENLIVTAEHRYLAELAEGYKTLQGKAYEIECIASDPDGNELLFEWSADGGGISGEGAIATWTAPLREDEITVTVTVSDGSGGVATESVVLAVATCAPCAFD